MKRSSKASPRERKVQSNKSQVQTKQGYHAGNIIKCSGYQNNRISSQLKRWILLRTLWISSTHLITANSSTNRTETSPKYRKKVVQTNRTLKQRLFEFVPVNNRLASHADILKGYHASLFFGRLLLFKETNQHWLIVKRKANHML